jgi:tRNA A37 threonylcarbamoyladenosine dehydratase
MNWLARTELLIGEEGLQKLYNARILIVGLGGVGSFAAEYLARAGIGNITIVDGDVVESTNRNRQLPALVSTEGVSKAEYMAQRMLDINPDLKLKVVNEYMVDEKLQEILNEHHYDYVIDAIDTITPKVALIKNCIQRKLRLVSAMGAGGKIDPEKVKVTTIWKTRFCPLAQQVRKTLRKWKVYGNFKAVYSTELPIRSSIGMVENSRHKKSYFGTISYLPSVFGAFCASVVIRDLVEM